MASGRGLLQPLNGVNLNATDRRVSHMHHARPSCARAQDPRMTVPLKLSQGRPREGNGHLHLRFGVLCMLVTRGRAVECDSGRGGDVSAAGARHSRTTEHAPSCESTTRRAYRGVCAGNWRVCRGRCARGPWSPLGSVVSCVGLWTRARCSVASQPTAGRQVPDAAVHVMPGRSRRHCTAPLHRATAPRHCTAPLHQLPPCVDDRPNKSVEYAIRSVE